jgi:hypothetical protein
MVEYACRIGVGVMEAIYEGDQPPIVLDPS